MGYHIWEDWKPIEDTQTAQMELSWNVPFTWCWRSWNLNCAIPSMDFQIRLSCSYRLWQCSTKAWPRSCTYLSGIGIASVQSINFIYACCNGFLKSMHRDKDIHVSFRLEPKRKINTNAVRHLRKASLFHPGGQQDILFSLYGVGNEKWDSKA